MRKCLAARGLDQSDRFRDLRIAAGAAYHGSASLCISDGHTATDATTGAGDDGDLTLKRVGIGLDHDQFPFCL
ncbi:hypothetical protein D3C76_1470980 [compost metagenome]